MKTSLATSLICSSAMAVILLGGTAWAQTSYFWDSDGTTAGFGNTTGTWGTSAFWSTSSAGTAATANSTITTNDTVNFGTATLNYTNATVTGPATAQGFLNMIFGAGQSTALTLSGGTLNLAPTSTITQNSTSASMTISSVLQGSGSALAVNGAGTLTLSGNNTYSGGTTLSAGTLVLSNAAALGSGTLAYNAGTLRFASGITAYTIQGLSGSANMALTNLAGTSVTITVGANNANTTYSGNFSGTDPALTRAGTGTLTLSGNDNFLRFLTVSTGVVNIDPGTGGLFTGRRVILAPAAGITSAVNFLSGTANLGTQSGPIAIGDGATNGTGNFVVTNSAVVNVNITNSSPNRFLLGNKGIGNLLVAGSGQLNLTNNGDIYIGGDISFASNNATGVLTVANSGQVNISGSGLLVLGQNALATTGANGTITLNGGTFTTSRNVSRGATSTGQKALINYNGGTFKAGASTVTIAAEVEGNVQAGGAIFDTAGNTINVASTLTNSGSLTKIGAGTLTLSAANTYSGGTTINAGTLSLTNGNALADTSSVTLSNNAGATLALNTSETIGSLRGGGAIGGNVSVASGQTLTVAETGNETFAGAITNTGNFIKSGAGTVTLTGANTYTGTTTVTNGVLALNRTGAQALGSTTGVGVGSGATLLISQGEQVNNSASVSLSGGTIQRGSGVTETFGALTLGANSTIDFGTGATGTLAFQPGIAGGFTPGGNTLAVVNFLPGNILSFGSSSALFAPGTYAGGYTGSGFNFGTQGFTASFASSTFTITAIPEPSAILAVLGLVGVMLWPMRRHLMRADRAAGGH